MDRQSSCAVITVSLMLGLAGCGGDDPPTPVEPQAQAPAPGAAAPPPTPTIQMGQPVPSTRPAPDAAASAHPTSVEPTPSGTMVAPSNLPPVSSLPPQDSKVATFSGLSGPKPATWLWQPPSRSFSVAEYVIPGRDGADQARLTVFRIGGDPQANIDRWAQQQFRGSDGQPIEPKKSDIEADGLQVIVAEFSGEYRPMGAPSFTPDRTMIGAIIPEAPGGQLILQFVGPTQTMQANREAIMNLLNNLRRAEPQK